jgi:hypothetical protein
MLEADDQTDKADAQTGRLVPRRVKVRLSESPHKEPLHERTE